MSIKEVEAAALKLIPKDRARLAGKLLEILENLSEEEHALDSRSRATGWGMEFGR
jgi:hypothetical protein